MHRFEEVWPLAGLEVTCGELTMREATDDDVLALAGIVEEGVVEPDEHHFMPFLLLGRADTPEERLAAYVRYHWNRRASLTADAWHLAFAVLVDGAVVGYQSVGAKQFAVTREVHSGSFLARHAQGRGIGTSVRALMLELCFAGLGAEWAASGYVDGNVRSHGVSTRLGYVADGIEIHAAPGGRAVTSNRLRLSRDRWLAHRPAWLDQAGWQGVDVARRLLGA